ncbi:unnamed protein product [Symbiodinium sp. CCMP2592]|nr:unnamed protein product [Symbiodinium sp. CCMP2592]
MEHNLETPAAAAGWGESVTQALQMGEESEVSAMDPLLLGGVSDDAAEPNYADALASQGDEPNRGGLEQAPTQVGNQPPPVQIARASPASPGHSELSRMEGGGMAAKWDPDEDELVPDYASMPVVPEGSGSHLQGSKRAEDIQIRGTARAAAMDVDEPSAEVRVNPERGLEVEAAVQRQVLSIFQSQVTPLLGQLMDRLEAMEARQSAQHDLASDFQRMRLGVESAASAEKSGLVMVSGVEHAWRLTLFILKLSHNLQEIGGTEIRPPPIAAAPKSPDVKAPQPVVSPPYPWPASNLPRSLPSLTAPPEVPSEMRGTSVRVEGDSFTNDCSGGLGSAGGSSEGREGLEWFYNGLKRVFATHGGDHDGRAEEVKTSTAELQKLVINDGDKEVSPLLAGDWLTLAGLHLILKAIPNSLKEELVSTQRMSCIDAVSLPDSTLLLAGLDLLTSKALSKFPAELEVLDTGIAKTTKAAKVDDTIDVCPYRGKGSAGTGDGASKGKGAKGGKKGSEEQPKGDAGAAADAAQTALHCVFVPDGKVKNRIEQWENDAGQQSTMNAEGVALIHEAMQGMGVADYAEGLCRAIEVDDGGEGIITAWTEALLRTMYPAVPDSVCDEVSRFLPGMHAAAEAITNMADVWKRYHDNAEPLKALAKRKVLIQFSPHMWMVFVMCWRALLSLGAMNLRGQVGLCSVCERDVTESAAFGSGPPNNNESVAAAPVRSTLAGQQVNGFAGALDAETGGFDDALEVPCEASFAAPVRNTLAGQWVNGSGGVLDVGTGGFDAHDDGILEAPGVDLMRFCGDDCEAIGVGEFGGFDWGVAAAQAPSEIEYSLLPDCEVLSTHTVPLPEVYKYFSRWRGSAEAELYSLIDDKKAFKRITLADIRRLEAEGARVTIVPGKAIFTRKSGGRYKTRIVICGNFVPEGWGEDGSGQQKASLYAAGCEVAHVRQIAARGAKAKWDGEPGQALAWIAVYVDDLFIMGQRVFALALVNKFRATWETDSVKEIPDLSQGTAAFFGIEFAWKGDQLLLGQQGYIRDLQTRYPHIKMQCVPLPPGNIDIPEVTRPDLMFGVSKLASSMSRNPTGTLPYIEHLLGYVFNTVDTVLAYSADDRTQELSCGIASEALHHITVHTDASFAPAAGRSHECVIAYQDGCLVTWLSSKQPFTAQSTAEAELLSTMTGYQLGRAHQYLASELFGCNVRLTVLNDNKEEFQADNVGIGYVPGVSNGADLGTKSEEADVLSEAQPDDEDNGSRRSSASPS